MQTKLKYRVTLGCDSILRCDFIIDAVESGIVGNYHEGKPYQPNMNELRQEIPFRFRKSLDRSLGWWQTNDMSGKSMPLRCDLVTLKGKEQGTLFAYPMWVNHGSTIKPSRNSKQKSNLCCRLG